MAQILDSWRLIERDDRAFAYEAELTEYQHAMIPVGEDAFEGVEAQLQLAKTLKLTVDGQRFVEHLRGQWPPLEPDGPLLEDCLHARACDGRESREFRLNLTGRDIVQGSFSKQATPDASIYLHYSSPLWLAHRPLALLKALRCDISHAAAKPNAEGNFEVVLPGHLPFLSIRMDVSPSAPYRPVALQMERGGHATHAWELLPPSEGGERFHVTGWKYKCFDGDGSMHSLTIAKVTTFTARPEINDTTFMLKFPLGAHIIGRTSREGVRTYWIQGINNELRPLPREQYGASP